MKEKTMYKFVAFFNKGHGIIMNEQLILNYKIENTKLEQVSISKHLFDDLVGHEQLDQITFLCEPEQLDEIIDCMEKQKQLKIKEFACIDYVCSRITRIIR